MNNLSYIFNAEPAYIDAIYTQYISDPQSVDHNWRLFFEGFEFNNGNGHSANGNLSDSVSDYKEFGVMGIINGFRSRGHLLSTTNPIRKRKDRKPSLELSNYGLSDSDLKSSISSR